jgi:hypothetical protein
MAPAAVAVITSTGMINGQPPRCIVEEPRPATTHSNARNTIAFSTARLRPRDGRTCGSSAGLRVANDHP